MKKLFFAVAAACGCAFFACAEQVQNWFSGGVASSVPTAVNGAWTSPSEGVTTNPASFTLDLDYDETLDFTPTVGTAPDTNVLTRLVSVVRFEPHNGTLPSPGADVKAVLMVSNTAYYAYANGAWAKLTNENVSVSEDLVTVLVEVDYKTGSDPRARFGIISDNVTNYLHAVGAEAGSWLAIGSTPTPALVSKVSFSGEGEVVSVRGDVQLGVASYNSVKYPTVQEAVDVAPAGGTVTVLRETTDSVNLNKNVTIADNGKLKGTVNTGSDVTVTITPAKAEFTNGVGQVTGESGIYTIPVNVTGEGDVVIALPADMTPYKEVGWSNKVDNAIRLNVRTKDSILADATTGTNTDLKNLIINEDLRSYLTTNVEAYVVAQPTANDIQSAMLSAGSNGFPVYQAFLLGIAPSTVVNAMTPPTGDTSTANITIALPLALRAEYSERYSAEAYVYKGEASQISTEDLDAIPVSLETGTYKIKVRVTMYQ